MDERLEKAARYGDLVSFVKEARNNEIESGCSEEYFLSQNSYLIDNILHLAIRFEQNEFIEKVLKEGELLPKAVTDELIKQQNVDGYTPLHVATRKGNIDILKLVLEYDDEQAKVKNGVGNTPLHLAVEYGKVEIARLLIKQRPEVATVTNIAGTTPLHYAVLKSNIEMARLLLEQHSQVASVTNKDGNTPLHLAVTYVEIEMAKMLIQHHHEMTRATNNFKETPLHLAIKTYKNTIKMTKELNKLTKLLLEKDSSVLCMHDKENMTPLHRAASVIPSVGVEVVNMILKLCPESAKEKDDLGRTILHYLIECVTTYKTGKQLLELPGINNLRNYKDNVGDTPLDLAWKINIKMVRALLDFLSQQYVHDSPSQQFVHDSASTYVVAQKVNDFEMIRKRRKAMEEYGVVDGVHLQFLKSTLSKFRNDFLFSRDSTGRNLLHNLMQLERGSPIDYEDFLKFILEVVDIRPKLVCQTDYNRETPVHILMRNSLNTKIHVNSNPSQPGKHIDRLGNTQLVEKLLCYCCKYFHIAKGANTEGIFKYEPPWLVQNVNGNTPLHEAFKANHVETIWETLANLEIDTTASLTNKQNETPLHLLAGCSYDKWPKNVIVDLVKANPKAGLSRDENGLNPMMRAIQVGNISTFQILFGLYFRAGDQIVDINNNNEDAQLYKDIEEAINKYVDEEMAQAQYDLVKKLLTDNDGCTLWHILLNQPPSKAKNLVKDIESKMHFIQLLKEADKEGNAQLIDRLEEGDEEGKTLSELIEQLKEGITPSHLIELLKEGDKQGKTPLQLIDLLKRGDKQGKTSLLLIELLKEKDKEGKTPLHLALDGRQFKHARYFLQCPCSLKSKERLKKMRELLDEKDGDGKTPSDLLASFTELPKKLQGLLEDNALVVGIRSFWDVPTTKIGEYANTMGVVAALITTITFTAAFTVPGGVVEGKGFPLFIKKGAFQAFMIADILAMCLSMMVLFCLLWFVATTDKSKSVVLMDFSLVLLLLSLYATLVSFMMGVCVTTIQNNPWIAIITIILCSLLVLLMHKILVMNYLVPAVKYGFKCSMKCHKVRSICRQV